VQPHQRFDRLDQALRIANQIVIGVAGLQAPATGR